MLAFFVEVMPKSIFRIFLSLAIVKRSIIEEEGTVSIHKIVFSFTLIAIPVFVNISTPSLSFIVNFIS